MQTFGKYATNFDSEFLSEHFIYINERDEENQDIAISLEEFEALLAKKRKTVAGTIFLYNPITSPLGYKSDKKLSFQGYDFDGKFCELEANDFVNLCSQAIREGYRGKLIEIKYLFNLNRPNIEPTFVLEEFESDLDRYTSNQLTRFDKNLNYHDYLNIRLNGKFVFFACGSKYDRHHKEIIKYVKNLANQAVKLGKDVSFIHDNNHPAEDCIEAIYFLEPLIPGKMRDKRIYAFKGAFKTNPPTIQKIS